VGEVRPARRPRTSDPGATAGVGDVDGQDDSVERGPSPSGEGAPSLDEADVVGSEESADPPGAEPATGATEVSETGTISRMFGSRQFFRLWLGMVVSAMGDWLGFLAIADLAARLGGEESGALAVGFVFMARVLPGLFFGPVVGVFVDRWDRKRVMVVCDLGRALVLFSLPFVNSVIGLIIASLVLEVLTLSWQPAKEASVPNLVPASRLASANSLSIVAAYGTFPLAAAAFAVLAKVSESIEGGWFAAMMRMDQASSLGFYVDAVTFLVSAFVIWSLTLPVRRRRKAPVDSLEMGGLAMAWRDLKEGWSFIASTPVVRAVNIGLATALIGGGMLVPLGKIFIDRVLGAGSAGFGLFLTVLGLGVATGVIVVSATQRRLPKTRVFTAVVFGSGVCLFGAASTTTLTPAAVFIFGLGVCAGTAYVVGFTLLHENVDDDLRGRIFSALNTLVRVCLITAFAVGPFLTQALDRLSLRLFDDSRATVLGLEIYVPGIRITLWLAAIIMIIAGVLAARALGREPGPAETDGSEVVHR
jgi:dTMP kinase